MIDLVGFSSHLEAGAYDLRTSIGEQAVERLKSLEDAIELLELEQTKYADFYPAGLSYQRVNDSIFLTVDLPDVLTPSIGDAIRKGMSSIEIGEIFTEEELKDEDTFKKAYYGLFSKSVIPLAQFIGLVARLHSHINIEEKSRYFPGAKTVVATGFRKQFIGKNKKEDFLSANFSFTNAYLAEPQLKNAGLYVDNNALQMLCSNRFAGNIVRFSSFMPQENRFDPFDEYEDLFYLPSDFIISQPVEVQIFRKNFVFRQMLPKSLGYLQILSKIMPYLNGEKEPNLSHMFKSLFEDIKNGLSEDCLKEKRRPESFIYKIRNSIADNITILPELIETGKSKVLEQNKAHTMSELTDLVHLKLKK